MADGSEFSYTKLDFPPNPFCVSYTRGDYFLSYRSGSTFNNGGPTCSITYVKCDPISSTLATSVQFTVYAQVVILSIFLFARRVNTAGVRALLTIDTYVDLFENVKVITED